MILWAVSCFAVDLTSMPALSTVTEIIDLLILLILVHCVCTATSGLLDGLDRPGAKDISRQGREVAKLYLYSSIVTEVCQVLILLLDASLLQMLAAIPALIAALISLVASILYLFFLYKSQKLLLHV